MWRENTHVSSRVETLDRQFLSQWYRWLELSVWPLQHKEKGGGGQHRESSVLTYNVSIDFIQRKYVVLKIGGWDESATQISHGVLWISANNAGVPLRRGPLNGQAFQSSFNLRAGSTARPGFVDLGSEPQIANLWTALYSLQSTFTFLLSSWQALNGNTVETESENTPGC